MRENGSIVSLTFGLQNLNYQRPGLAQIDFLVSKESHKRQIAVGAKTSALP